MKKSIAARAAFVAASAAAAIAAPASAGVITQDTSNDMFQIQAFEPLGQSFTAIDTALVSIGFKFTVLNPGFSATDPVQVDLYQGVGTGGQLLATRTLSLPANANAGSFTDFNFAGVATTVGQQYSAVLSIVGNSPYYAVEVQKTNPYAGGALFSANTSIFSAVGCPSGNCDARFQVTGSSTSAVPEPATWAMMMLGFGSMGFAMRRKPKVSSSRIRFV